MSVKATRLKGVPFLILALVRAPQQTSYPTVKAALRHESAESEEDHEGLGCHLGQGLRLHVEVSVVSFFSSLVFLGKCVLAPLPYNKENTDSKSTSVAQIYLDLF